MMRRNFESIRIRFCVGSSDQVCVDNWSKDFLEDEKEFRLKIDGNRGKSFARMDVWKNGRRMEDWKVGNPEFLESISKRFSHFTSVISPHRGIIIL